MPPASPPTAAPAAADVRTLEMMLDCAIVEGAALRLPAFVLLLRAAQVALASRRGDQAVAGPAARLNEIGSLLTLGEKSNGHASLFQDRPLQDR